MGARRRNTQTRQRALPWFIAGLVTGLGLATMAVLSGKVPVPQRVEQPATAAAPGPAVDDDPIAGVGSEEKTSGPRYDFFTVLPEMEVVVPDAEIQARARTPENDDQPGAQQYILQIGSFRESQDAEALKAQMALLGMVAEIQAVNVNGSNWHRVRIGPLDSARAADTMRRQLAGHGIDAMVLADG